MTNTALWLSQFGTACQCYKVTPYQTGSELFLNVEHIIPTPESSDFMIGMVAKEDEEKSADTVSENLRKHLARLWTDRFDEKDKPDSRYLNLRAYCLAAVGSLRIGPQKAFCS